MPQVMKAAFKRAANYSNCPLKKRPIKYELDDNESDSDYSYKGKFKFFVWSVS